MKCAHKKSVEPFVGIFEVLDNSILPIYNVLNLRKKREDRYILWNWFLKVSKSQDIHICYFAFFYSMMCILNYALCFIGSCVS